MKILVSLQLAVFMFVGLGCARDSQLELSDLLEVHGQFLNFKNLKEIVVSETTKTQNHQAFPRFVLIVPTLHIPCRLETLAIDGILGVSDS